MRLQVYFGVSWCSERLEMTWNHLELALDREFSSAVGLSLIKFSLSIMYGMYIRSARILA